MHSHHSPDSLCLMRELCEQAAARGAELITITDHWDFDVTCEEYYKPQAYFDDLERTREAFAGRLTVLAGVEFSEPHLHQALLEDANSMPYDYILGSLHYWGFRGIYADDAIYAGPCYDAYWHELRRMVAYGGYDAVGHLDLPFRYLKVLEYEEDVVDEIFSLMQITGLVPEINTSSLRRGLNETMPNEALLRRYAARGGKYVTLGSDAHHAEDVCAGLPEARALADRLGLKATYFQRRKQVIL
jgi:histidinol-phosphatase (PHP family)